jgi:phage-related baseplate assembly protein
LAGNAAPDVVLAAAQARLHALLYDGEGPDNARLDGRQHRLGVDIVPSQLASVIAGAGIYDVILDQPAAATVVQSFEWATCTGIDLTVIGAAHG